MLVEIMLISITSKQKTTQVNMTSLELFFHYFLTIFPLFQLFFSHTQSLFCPVTDPTIQTKKCCDFPPYFLIIYMYRAKVPPSTSQEILSQLSLLHLKIQKHFGKERDQVSRLTLTRFAIP